MWGTCVPIYLLGLSDSCISVVYDVPPPEVKADSHVSGRNVKGPFVIDNYFYDCFH